MNSTSLVFIGLGFCCLLAAVYPFGPYQFTLLLARRLRRFKPAAAEHAPASGGTFAICLCAHNEEQVIRKKIENMLALRRAAGQLDILIYVDAASDRTAEIIKEYQDEVTLYASTERHGKPWGMNRLVAMTDADIVLFTDANVMVDEQAIVHLRRYFANPEVGCVCSHLSYVNPGASATSEVGSFYWRLDEWTKGLETETGSAMGADGSLFAIRRSLHRPVQDHLIDDLMVSMNILCDGYRLVRAPEVLAFEAHTTVARDEFKRKIRIACQCMGVHLELWPKLKRLSAWNFYKYIAHRFLRWIGGYLLLAAALSFALAIWAGFGFLAMAGAVLALAVLTAAGLAFKIRLVEQIINVLYAFAGNTLGVWRAFWGEPVVTWDLAGSARKDTVDGRPGS